MLNESIPPAVQEIPPFLRFAVRGQSFQLDLLSTIYAFHDIAEAVAKQGGSHRAYLDALINHLQDTTGVELTYGEADWLNDRLEIEFATAKKKRRDLIASALSLPSSTASTPPDLAE